MDCLPPKQQAGPDCLSALHLGEEEVQGPLLLQVRSTATGSIVPADAHIPEGGQPSRLVAAQDHQLSGPELRERNYLQLSDPG